MSPLKDAFVSKIHVIQHQINLKIGLKYNFILLLEFTSESPFKATTNTYVKSCSELFPRYKVTPLYAYHI